VGGSTQLGGAHAASRHSLAAASYIVSCPRTCLGQDLAVFHLADFSAAMHPAMHMEQYPCNRKLRGRLPLHM